MIQRIKNNAFARNSLILFTGTLAANVLNYVFHLLVGRMVSIQAYGEVESLTSIINIISVPGMALTMVATKFSAGFKATDDKKGTWDLWSYFNKKIALVIIPIFFIMIVITPWVRDFMNVGSNWPVLLVWILIIVSLFGAVTLGILTGWQKFKEGSWVGILSIVVKLAVGIFLVKIGLAASGVIGSFVVATVFSYIAGLYILRPIIKFRKKEKADDKIEKKINFSSVKKFIMPAFCANLAINLIGNVDMVLAKHNLDPHTAGQYGALFIVSKIIFFATGVIATVLFSMSAENVHLKNNKSAIIFKQAFFGVLALSLGASLVYFVFPKFVLGMLFGNKYADVANFLGWFAVAVTLFSLVNLIVQYLLSLHRTGIAYGILAVSSVEIVALLLIGKNIPSILGIVIATQLVSIVICLVCLYNNKEKRVNA
jgi:O-antigen/teichoic acid export membrane protein